MSGEGIRIGIGFATGRKSFRKVLATYIYNMAQSGLTDTEKITLDFFIAYDLKYNNTRSVDYTNIHQDLTDMIGDLHFLGETHINGEIGRIVEKGILTKEEASLIFANGYAGKRNIVLYEAIRHRMTCLLFLDDDEYPLAVTNSKGTAIWSGQNVLRTHLDYIRTADITNGHHCGYISPIPCVNYDENLSEEAFRKFIGVISNDIVNWEKMKSLMDNRGVTYAEVEELVNRKCSEVPESGGTKFITGANLCVNLSSPDRVKPFYNPPGARGEDTFLSTCLAERKVLRVPCYTFHDGFSTYHYLLNGVLPMTLKGMSRNEEQVVQRFYRACLGWIRYKPLLLFITEKEQYEEKIKEMQENLMEILPAICRYFGTMAFMRIPAELETYHKNVRVHYDQFLKVQSIWDRLMEMEVATKANQTQLRIPNRKDI